ncbi:MAG: flavodoxin domain-containing protein [Bifidobacteriaceae bacterium]|jgi:menaquinone-dependent protoporphyrinogen oxidase|nr:flavodoxin domain-containing protein [Bifidobacteriaceae bacterium]
MKALITVASKHGSTLELGRAIAAVLEERGIEVDLVAPQRVGSLAEYEAVILGSAVYANKMLPTMTALCYRWGDQLAGRLVYLFCSGPLGVKPREFDPLPHDARGLARQLGARSTRLFGGRVELGELKPTERALMRMIGAKPGDYRDPHEVRRWAKEVADDMTAQH